MTPHTTPHSPAQRGIIAMKKARSLMDRVGTMMAEQMLYTDIIQQNLAIIGLLRSANLALLEGRLIEVIGDTTAPEAQDMLAIMRIAHEK
jgi:DNA-binding FrmR family transcriptional regulator